MANENPEQPKPETVPPETPPPQTEEEAPPKVIEIKPPPPLEEALDPIIDMFMEVRGLKDKKQAAVKLANVLYHLGFNPQREIDNVTTYINNMSAILQSIPDTPETAPVKGALLARTATEAALGLRKAHALPSLSEEEELEREARFYRRMAMSMRMMDSIFKGGESTTNPEVEALKEKVKILEQQLRKGEEEKALDAKLAPIREQLNILMHRIENLTQPKPPTEEESGLSKEVKQMLDAMNKRLDTLDQRYQTSQEIQSIRNEIATLKTSLEKSGKPSDVTDVFDQAVKLIDKVNEVVKKAGGVGEGEFDWRAAAISSASEIATEAISAYKEIAAAKPREEEQPKTMQKQPEKVSEQIVDRKLLSYIQGKLAQGAKEFLSTEAAQVLGVPEEEILKSFQRLKAKGILRSVGGETGGAKQQTEPAEWVEG
jgi:hypothetical protein